MSKRRNHPRKLAVMGGAYGNLAALESCLADAGAMGADLKAFTGDGIGCCGHSNEVVSMIRDGFDLFVAGNHEQQAVARSTSCGCGYSSPDDEKISCEAFEIATAALDDPSRDWFGTWPDEQIVEMEGGRVLLCHGSPGQTSEFLYETELDDLRLEAWLDRFEVQGFVCTHSGLPWVRLLGDDRFAVNCGVVGKPDHDGDPAIHYALIDLPADDEPVIEIRRVAYDHEGWARKMEAAGIAPIFVEPVVTGVWNTGVASLPPAERFRWLRAPSRRETKTRNGVGWKPEFLDAAAWRHTLREFHAIGLVSEAEIDEALSLLDPAFPFFSAMRLADSVHLHVKVDDTADLPTPRILALGTTAENARPGYIKYPFPGGINLIFSSIPVAEEDQLTEDERENARQRTKPFVDHYGIDLRREMGIVRAVFEDTSSVARRAGWPVKFQGGGGRRVFCCHSMVAEKCWVYPPAEGSRWTRPFEFAYGPLEISQEMNGCDLRPIDPRHLAAGNMAACAPAAH
jgi:diadenosine tetraphosphatase ApaH/serine/threonine PP2A family protein phosphatase